MTMTLDAPDLTLLFMATVVTLATALVWMFYELESRFGKRLTTAALVRFGLRGDRSADRRRD